MNACYFFNNVKQKRKSVIHEICEYYNMQMDSIIIIYSNTEGHGYKKEFRGRWMCLETG